MACPGAGMRTFPCICRGQPCLTAEGVPHVQYSPRTRGSTYGGVSGCRYANISLHKQGCPILADIRNLAIRSPLRWQGRSDANLIQTIHCFLNSPHAGLVLRNRCPFRRITPFLCFRRVGSSVRKKDVQWGRNFPCIGRGLSIGNKYTNSPRIDGVEPKTKTASTEELPCASGGSKVVCICHSNLCICGEKSTKAR